MMEIAISLAVIGIALVAIIGVLPIGMNVQKTNRQDTIVGQDATVFMNAIRNGSLGLDDLTNYVYAISNYWAIFPPLNSGSPRSGVNGYTYRSVSVDPRFLSAAGMPAGDGQPLTNGANIIGLLSTPEYIGANSDGDGDAPGQPIPSLYFGGISNHIVAYCYSISGPAIEKPPQDNPILQQDSFGYRLYCVNAPTPVDTNMFIGLWSETASYAAGQTVFFNWMYWGSRINGNSGNPPYSQSPYWAMSPDYTLEMALNLHELRLTFLYPQLPNGHLGSGRGTYRTLIAGQILRQPIPGYPYNVWYNTNLYYYLPQSFTNTP